LRLGEFLGYDHPIENGSLISNSDPWPASIILWTRVAPTLVSDRSNITVNGTAPLYNHDTEEYIGTSAHPICVEYVVTSDPGLKQVVDKGTAYTTSDIDYTVKVFTIRSVLVGSLTDNSLGRGHQPQAFHSILVSMDGLWLRHQESHWSHENHSSP